MLLRDMAGMGGENRAELLGRALVGSDAALEKARPFLTEYTAAQLIRANLLRELAGLRGENRAERMAQAMAAYDELLELLPTSPLDLATVQTNRASLVDIDAGTVIREFLTPADRGSGITCDTVSLWIASTYNRKLIKVDPQTGQLQAEYESPGSGVVKWGEPNPKAVATGGHGLEWRAGELFWPCLPRPKSSFFAPATPPSSVAPAPGIRPHGVGLGSDGALCRRQQLPRVFQTRYRRRAGP
jgi:hypothetical protein